MRTGCSPRQLEFQGLGSREVVAAFNGGRQTSDAGVLLLREVAEGTRLIRRFASCFTDHRRAERIEHTVEELLGQPRIGPSAGLRRSALPGFVWVGSSGRNAPKGSIAACRGHPRPASPLASRLHPGRLPQAVMKGWDERRARPFALASGRSYALCRHFPSFRVVAPAGRARTVRARGTKWTHMKV